MKDFPWDGEISVEYYEEAYPRYLKFGDRAAACARWDLECMTKRWSMIRSRAMEPVIRAQKEIVEDLEQGW